MKFRQHVPARFLGLCAFFSVSLLFVAEGSGSPRQSESVEFAAAADISPSIARNGDDDTVRIQLTTGWNRVTLPVASSGYGHGVFGKLIAGPIWTWSSGSFAITNELRANEAYWIFSRGEGVLDRADGVGPAEFVVRPVINPSPVSAAFRSVSAEESTLFVTFSTSGENLDAAYTTPGSDFALTLGVSDHPEVTNGFDLDIYDAPGLPPSPFVIPTGKVYFIVEGNNQTQEMIRDVKPLLPSLRWRLRIDFGDPDETGAASSDITLSWTNAEGKNPFNELLPLSPYGYTSATMVEEHGDTLADLRTTTSIQFSGTSPVEVRIILVRGEHIGPEAVADTATTLKETGIAIDVVGNDLDADGDPLTITQVEADNPGARVEISDGMIRYTPALGFVGIDTFQYTISDGGNTSSTQVTVLVAELFATRSHATVANSGNATPDSGLLVEIEITFSVALQNALTSADSLRLTEVFPTSASALEIYRINDFGGDVLDISGQDAALITVPPNVNGLLTEVPFLVSLPVNQNVIRFSYRLIGPLNDFSYTKQLSGHVSYVLGGNQPIAVDVRDKADVTRNFTTFTTIGPEDEGQAGIIYVNHAANGADNGRSWADAYKDLRTAISLASDHSEMWVAAGRYTPGVTRDSTFQLKAGMALYGGFAGYELSRGDRDWEANETILNGDVSGDDGSNYQNYDDNVDHVVHGGDESVLDGFTVSGGNAFLSPGGGMYNHNVSVTVANCAFRDNWADETGGGMHNYLSSVLISNCSFRDNFAGFGGGVDIAFTTARITDCRFSANEAIVRGGGLDNYSSFATVTGCTFSRNTAEWGGGIGNFQSSASFVFDSEFSDNTAQLGGGMVNDDSAPTVENCTFIGNSAVEAGGGVCNINFSNPQHAASLEVKQCVFTFNSAGTGGGVYIRSTSPLISECIFGDNSAELGGGGLSIYGDGSEPAVVNCYFWGNSSQIGGAVYDAEGSALVANCALSGNTADDAGGAVYVENASPRLVNCTISGNSAPLGAGLYNYNGPRLFVGNSIFWGSVGEQPSGFSTQISHGEDVSPTIVFCLIQGWPTSESNGNISSDPRFHDADGPDDIFGTSDDNLHLSSGSPAIDAGSNNVLSVDYTAFSQIDLAGNPRLYDDAGTVNTGDGEEAAVVDMGAFEFIRVALDSSTLGVANDHDTDRFYVAVNPGEFPVRINDTPFSDAMTTDFTALAINGSGDDDVLIIDFSNGNPIPAAGLVFNGGGHHADGDILVLQGGGIMATVTHRFTNAADGTIQIDGSEIAYTGLEPIQDNLSATDRVFMFGGVSDAITLSDDGNPDNDTSRIQSASSSETVDFMNPEGTLAIHAGDGNDRISLHSVDNGLIMPVTLKGNAGNDSFFLTIADIAHMPLILDGGQHDTGDFLSVDNRATAVITNTGSSLTGDFETVNYSNIEFVSIGPPETVPTLSEWGVVALILLLAYRAFVSARQLNAGHC